MLGVRPAATPTYIIMPGKMSKRKPPSSAPPTTSFTNHHVKLQALYDTILQDTHPRLVRRRNVELAQLSTMYGSTNSPRPDIIALSPSPRPTSTSSRRSSASLSRGGGRSVKSAVSLGGGAAAASPAPLRSISEAGYSGAARSMQHQQDDETETENAENAVSRCVTSLTMTSTCPTELERSGSRSSAFCRRVKSAVDREVEGLVNSLSRNCCEVLGPDACHECDVVNRQHHNPHGTAEYPTLHPSEDNFTKSILVSRMMPGMSEYTVQTKLACGEIARESFKERLDRMRQKQEEEKERNNEDDNKGDSDTNNQVVLRDVPNAAMGPKYKVYPMFFTSIRDLNAKLIDSKAPCHALIQKPTKATEDQSFTEKLCPSFISPKKMKKAPQSSFRANYELPLLPKVRQTVEPAFFAGSAGSYALPDRLPESMVLDPDMNLGDPNMSRMSTNYSINAPTPQQY